MTRDKYNDFMREFEENKDRYFRFQDIRYFLCFNSENGNVWSKDGRKAMIELIMGKFNGLFHRRYPEFDDVLIWDFR